jgi:hypothetical protein
VQLVAANLKSSRVQYLTVLTEIIEQAAGIENTDNISESQVEGLSGSLSLRFEVCTEQLPRPTHTHTKSQNTEE